MSQSVQNDSGEDIYAEWGYDADSDFGLEDYAEQDAEYGLTYIGTAGARPGGQSLSLESEWNRIDQMVNSPELSTAAKDELETLQRKLTYLASMTGDELTEALAEVDAELNQIEKPDSGKGGKNASLDEQLLEFKETHPEMSAEQVEQIDKWTAAYDLDPDSGDLIKKEFKDFQELVLGASVYGDTVTRLASSTGMKMSAVQAVFDQHGISDAENLSDSQIELVLSDFGGKELASAESKVAETRTALEKAWDSAAKNAEKVNATNRADDDPSNNYNSFKQLLEISRFQDDKSLAYADACEGLADATAPILAALKGIPEEQVETLRGDGKAGMLSIGGAEYNVVGNPRTGEIALKEEATHWPQFDLNEVKLYINDDMEVPSWVKEEGYPCEGEDGGMADILF